jgi:hypothetical protein
MADIYLSVGFAAALWRWEAASRQVNLRPASSHMAISFSRPVIVTRAIRVFSGIVTFILKQYLQLKDDSAILLFCGTSFLKTVLHKSKVFTLS